MFSVIRRIQSYCPCLNGDNEESIRFAKYERFEDDQELESPSNWTSKSPVNGAPRVVGDPRVVGCDNDTCDGEQKISEWQAGWNVTNAIQGMFIVSFPYAVVQGGYWAIVAMVLVAYICCYTGKILVKCLYEENELGAVVRVRNSYVQIADHVLGERFGGKIVNCAQVVELLMTCILYVLLCGHLFNGSFPGLIDLSSWIILSTFLLLPCAFLQSLRSVSWLSFWCTMAHMAINAIIIIYCFTKVSEWRWSDVQLRIDIWTFPLSLGIIVFSYTSQIFMPTLEGNLINRDRFHCMMNVTHVAAALFKAVFSYIGFLMWGWQTQEVITNNLPTQGFKITVNLILVVKALFSYPLPYYAAVDLIETAIFKGRPLTVFPACLDEDKRLKIWGLALRFALVLVTMALAIGIPYFAILMSLIGSFTGTMLSFVWPCWFHLKIKWYKLKWYQKAADICIIVLGISFGSIGIYYSAHALSQATQGLPTNPYKTHIPVKIDGGE